jgi:hypothetical protein
MTRPRRRGEAADTAGGARSSLCRLAHFEQPTIKHVPMFPLPRVARITVDFQGFYGD